VYTPDSLDGNLFVLELRRADTKRPGAGKLGLIYLEYRMTLGFIDML
jgi:hypothetical protein